MTDSPEGQIPEWVPVLRHIARASGHELRNALNALVVNLEVVRSHAGSLDVSAQEFVAQAVAQSEESVRLAEGTIALLNLLVGAVSESGALQVQFDAPRAIRIESTESEASRAVRALSALTLRTGFVADVSDAAVILSSPETRPKTKEHE